MPDAPRPQHDLDALRDAVEAAVREAGEAILAVVRRGGVRVGHKWGEGPVTEADYAADDVLHRRLMPLIPGAHWLSEESEQEAPLIHGEPTWVVDPLDGTREFVQGLPEYAVSVALFVDDRLLLGAVGLPYEDRVLSGVLGGDHVEARDNGARVVLREPRDPLRLVVSRNDYRYRSLHEVMSGYELYPSGSAAVKLVHVVDGRADAYWSSGPRSVWDAAGGAAVLHAAGGALVQFDQQPFALTPRRVRIEPYAAGRRDVCEAILAKVHARIQLRW